MKLGQKVLIPVKQFPKFNFVGKLLGPRGNSLKRLQEDTLTKMSILGKGSMRDKEKEEELRKSGEAKYNHLNEDLHVLIEVFAPPAEAYARMGHALEEIKKFLIPAVVPRGAAPRGAPSSRPPSSRGRAQRGRGAPPPAGYRPPPPVVQDSYGEYQPDPSCAVFLISHPGQNKFPRNVIKSLDMTAVLLQRPDFIKNPLKSLARIRERLAGGLGYPGDDQERS
ncbi:KH domain-containing, RNA-binding, signal transduction-associated protein 3 [Bagarius yarrelli]|uniref:KH domain-containing, RNA-binding, signal transduction-associated protein 3 n=1 Tax=Bagarius yarrelli TaxID=175774 RepID=A0A556V1J4_BAGYA|nr:KH domain-containing, RNA-binding, signal transduction-associated protein 3 [Bagarius yarrelli]